jgi:hypothetical protein
MSRVPTPDGERAETLSKECVAEIRAFVMAKGQLPVRRKGDVVALCDSHERLRARLSERPTLSQADADSLINTFGEAVLADDASRTDQSDQFFRDARAALRAALLGEKP